MKRELISTHVDEAFTMPTLKDFKSAPNAFIEDVKDVLCNKDRKKKKKKTKTYKFKETRCRRVFYKYETKLI